MGQTQSQIKDVLLLLFYQIIGEVKQCSTLEEMSVNSQLFLKILFHTYWPLNKQQLFTF